MKETQHSGTPVKPTYSAVYHVDGRLRLSLRTVLDIFGVDVITTDATLKFVSQESRELQFSYDRHPDGINTAWDAMRDRKMLERETFEPIALDFLEANPRYTA